MRCRFFSISSAFVCLLLYLFIPLALFSQTVAAKINPKKEGIINSSGELSYFSNSPFANQINSFLTFTYDKNLKTTGRYYNYKYNTSNDCELDNIPTLLTDFSSLKDVSYFSISAGKEKKLFYDIYIISSDYQSKNLKKNPPMPLIPVNNISAFPHHFNFFQKDGTLGESIWHCTIDKKNEHQFLLCYYNITPLKKGAITAIKPNNLKMVYSLTVNKNESSSNTILVDAAVVAQIDNLFPFKDRVNSSLANRLHATAVHLIKTISNNTAKEKTN